MPRTAPRPTPPAVTSSTAQSPPTSVATPHTDRSSSTPTSLTAIVRVRPKVGLPACSGREPPRHPDPCRRAPRLTAQVRRAVPADAPAIAEVHVASWRAAYPGLVPQA